MLRITPVTKHLLIVNVLAFIACIAFGSSSYGGYLLNDLLGLHFFKAADFQLYQLFTYMFMHASFEHLFFNMFALWMFGTVVERVWGPKKFIFYYISCGVGAGLIQELAQYVSIYMQLADSGLTFSMLNPAQLNGLTTVGASGAIYAILLAFGMIFPEERIFIFPLPIPIKAKWFVMGYAVIELFSAMATTSDNVAHLAHLGGMLFGFFMIRYWQKHPTDGYDRSGGEQFFDNLRQGWEKRKKDKKTDAGRSSQTWTTTSTHARDWEYNARQQEEQKEIDRILDKIRKSGYDSLTAEEKHKLFEQGNKK